tara:strand:- start:2579 stop:3985 length:1407 start_codon:yes stop_codon:yes gene_type:complete
MVDINDIFMKNNLLPRSTAANPYYINQPQQRTNPYSVFTTPKSRFSALPAKEGSYTLGQGMPQNTFASGMEQNAKNVYAKPAFVRPRQTNPANVPPNQLGQNLLNFALSGRGQAFAQGIGEKSGYSTMPISFGEVLASGMKSMSAYDQAQADRQVEIDKLSFEKEQALIDNLFAQQGLDIEMQKLLKPKLSNFAQKLVDFGIDPNSVEGRALLLQELQNGKIQINLGDKGNFQLKSDYYNNSLIPNSNKLIEDASNNNDIRNTYANMLRLIQDGVDTGVYDSAFLGVKRFLRDTGVLSDTQAENVTQQELFDKLSSFTVPRMRVAGSGSTSDFEGKLYTTATATLGDDESTNNLILLSRLAALNLQREYSDFYSQYSSQFEMDSNKSDFSNKAIGDAFREYLNDDLNILSNIVGVDVDNIILNKNDLQNKIQNGILKAGDFVFSNDESDGAYNSFILLTQEDIDNFME